MNDFCFQKSLTKKTPYYFLVLIDYDFMNSFLWLPSFKIHLIIKKKRNYFYSTFHVRYRSRAPDDNALFFQMLELMIKTVVRAIYTVNICLRYILLIMRVS